jgi:hypothetical protein
MVASWCVCGKIDLYMVLMRISINIQTKFELFKKNNDNEYDKLIAHIDSFYDVEEFLSQLSN